MDYKFQADICHKGQNVAICTTRKITLNESFMGECKVTATIESPSPIDFAIGDYLIYRGRKYVLAVTPSMQKQARVRSVGNAIKYDNVTFISVASDELTRCEFRDVVNGNEHYNFAARTFNFHCISLADYAERLKANLDRMYKGTEAYTIKVLCNDGTIKEVNNNHSTIDAVGKTNIVITSSDETCWDSLSHVKDDFKVNLYIEADRTIVLGANGNMLSQYFFEYGQSKGMFKISRTTDESQKVITRLRAYGSEKNLPTRFYSNVAYLYLLPKEQITRCVADIDGKQINVLSEDVPEPFTAPDHLTIGFSPQMLAASPLSESSIIAGSTAKLYLIKVRIDDVSVWMNIQYNGTEVDSYANIGWTNDKSVISFGDNTEAQVRAFTEKFVRYKRWSYLVLESGYTQTWKYKVSDPSITVPNNMAVKNLMLAGFGSKDSNLRNEIMKVYANPTDPDNAALITRLGYDSFYDLTEHFDFSTDPSDPYIDAVKQKAKYGINEGTVVFDGSKDEYEEIRPSIEHLGSNKDICPEQSAKIEDATEATGNNLRNDGGVCDDLVNAGQEIPQFYIYIKDPSFDPYEYRKDGATSFKMNMIDGMCGGRTFDCKQSLRCTFADGTRGYRLTCDRVLDSSLDLYYPYSQISNGMEIGFVIKEGDRYTFSEIEMPKEYVFRTALYELVPAAVEALAENCEVHFKYELSIDPVEMARQHKASLEDTEITSIHDTIHAGDLVLFGDEDLGVNYRDGEPEPIGQYSIIDSLEIKEGEGKLPQYSVQLADDKGIGTWQRIQKQIDSIVSGATAVGGNVRASDIENIVRRYCSTRYLSKVTSDTMNGSLTVKGNILSDRSSTGDESWVGSSEFMEGLLGKGWRAYFNGHIEADSLSLRRFLEVPEIRFNRTTVTVGVTWHTVGAGIIEEVAKGEYDYTDFVTGKSKVAQGMVKLKLEDGEVGAVAYDDLAMGIWHNLGNSAETTNAKTDYDGHDGNFTFAGFQTIYFRVVSLCHKDGAPVEYDDEGNIKAHYDSAGNDITCRNAQYFLYELREKKEGDHGWHDTFSPVSGMHFACYANRTNPSRQSCWYQTTTYFIMLAGMTDWTYDSNSIQVLLGQRSGFTIRIRRWDTGEEVDYPLEGMGAAFGNVTRWGTETVVDRPPTIVSQQLLWINSTIDFDTLKEMSFTDILEMEWKSVSSVPPKPTAEKPYLYYRWLFTYDNAKTSDGLAKSEPSFVDAHPEVLPYLDDQYGSDDDSNYVLQCEYAIVSRDSFDDFNTADAGALVTTDKGRFNTFGDLAIACYRYNGAQPTKDGYLCYLVDDGTEAEYTEPISVYEAGSKITFNWYSEKDATKRILWRTQSVSVVETPWDIVIDKNNVTNLPKNETITCNVMVLVGKKDVTEAFDDSHFTWSRVSGQSEAAIKADEAWAEKRKADLHKKSLVVGDEDLYKSAEFFCEFDDGRDN